VSLRTLLLAVAVAGLGFAAIASGERWTIATFFTVVAVILTGVSLRTAISGARDHTALAFAVCAWSYFAIWQSHVGPAMIHSEATEMLLSRALGLSAANAVSLWPRYSTALTCAHSLWMLAFAGIGAFFGQRYGTRHGSTDLEQRSKRSTPWPLN
jgi:hypothetical protein